MVSLLAIDTRIKLLLFLLINFMVFGLKDFVLGSVCFSFICILSCLMGQKKIVLKYIVFYVVIAAIQQLCIYLPQAIETILSIFTLFIRVMIPVVLFASTFIATTKVSELIAAMYSLKIPRSITMTTDMFISLVRKYTRAKKLTPRMLNELVEKIEVFNAEKVNGVWEQRLRIHYNCVGTIEIPSALPLPTPDVSVNTRKGVVVNYAPCDVAI